MRLARAAHQLAGRVEAVGTDRPLMGAIGHGIVRIGRTEQGHAGDVEGSGEMHEAGVDADGEVGAGDELGQLLAVELAGKRHHAGDPRGETGGTLPLVDRAPWQHHRAAGRHETVEEVPPAFFGLE